MNPPNDRSLPALPEWESPELEVFCASTTASGDTNVPESNNGLIES